MNGRRFWFPAGIAIGVSGLASAQAVHLVTNTADSGAGSLRQAIADANATPGTDVVRFAIPGPGPHTIQPLLELTTVGGGIEVDGYSQPGASPNTNSVGSRLGSDAVLQIELNGSRLGPGGQDGLRLIGNGILIRGLAINGFGVGVRLSSGTDISLEGCFIGTDVTGTVARPNLGSGVIASSTGGRVGGVTPSARNVISANFGNGVLVNGDGTSVSGNLIGTDRTGTVDLGNQDWGVYVGFLAVPEGVVIGGRANRAGNVIAGNGRFGVRFNLSVEAALLGNLIGTDVTGEALMRNDFGGVVLEFATDTRIGGGLPRDRNVISSHLGPGIDVTPQSSGTVIQGNYVGLDVDGTQGFGNVTGVLVRGPAVVGGLGPGQGNVVSGSVTGIRIQEVDGIDVLGNTIGSDPTGKFQFANGRGIDLRLSNDDRIEENRVYFNTVAGILLRAAPDVTNLRNRISRNSIFGNTIGIDLGSFGDGPSGVTPNDPGDLDEGPNRLQNYPALSFAYEHQGTTVVVGSLSSRPGERYVVELFTSRFCGFTEHGEGEIFLGSLAVATDASGFAPFTFTTRSPVLPVVSATARDAEGNTSEFSLCKPVLRSRRL